MQGGFGAWSLALEQGVKGISSKTPPKQRLDFLRRFFPELGFLTQANEVAIA